MDNSNIDNNIYITLDNICEQCGTNEWEHHTISGFNKIISVYYKCKNCKNEREAE